MKCARGEICHTKNVHAAIEKGTRYLVWKTTTTLFIFNEKEEEDEENALHGIYCNRESIDRNGKKKLG